MGETLSKVWKKVKKFVWNYKWGFAGGIGLATIWYVFIKSLKNISYTNFLKHLNAGEVKQVTVYGNTLRFKLADQSWATTNRSLISDTELFKQLQYFFIREY